MTKTYNINQENTTISIKHDVESYDIKVAKDVNIKVKEQTVRVENVTPTYAVTDPKKTFDLGTGRRGEKGDPGADGLDGRIQEIVAGAGMIIDNTDPARPILSATGGSGDKNYTQEFTALSVVSATHNLQKYPSVTVINSAGDEVVGSVEYTDINNIIVTFTAPFTGRLTLN